MIWERIIVACLICVVLSCKERSTTSRPSDCNPIEVITPPELTYAVAVRPEIVYNDTHATIQCQLPPGYETVQLFDEADRYRNGIKELSFTYFDMNWLQYSSTTRCDKSLKSFGVDYQENFPSSSISSFVAIKKVWCYAFNWADWSKFDRELNIPFKGSNCQPIQTDLYYQPKYYPAIVQNSSMVVSVKCPKVDGFTAAFGALREVYFNGNVVESSPDPTSEESFQLSCLNFDGREAFGSVNPWSGSFSTYKKVGCSYY